jgi:hypothetical protein
MSCSEPENLKLTGFRSLTGRGWDSSAVGELWTDAAIAFIDQANANGNKWFLNFNSQAVRARGMHP